MEVMTMMKKKILTSTIALVAALGLAGCSTNATSTTTGHEPQATKVAKAPSHKTNKKSTNSTTSNKTAKATSESQKAASSASEASSTSASSNTNSKATLKAANAATTATSSANGTTTKSEGQVLNNFMAKSGVKAEQGSQYIVTNQGNGQYQIEVRNSKGDPNISHLSGLYHYNTNTNHVSQMNVTTGQFN